MSVLVCAVQLVRAVQRNARRGTLGTATAERVKRIELSYDIRTGAHGETFEQRVADVMAAAEDEAMAGADLLCACAASENENPEAAALVVKKLEAVGAGKGGDTAAAKAQHSFATTKTAQGVAIVEAPVGFLQSPVSD